MQSEAPPTSAFPPYLMEPPTQPLPLRGVFHPLGFAVEILTNDHAVLEAAEEAWGHLKPRRMTHTLRVLFAVHGPDSDVCPPYPTPSMHGSLLGLVSDSDNHALCDFDSGICFAKISRAALNNRLYFRYHFLESLPLSLLSCGHAPALHAACVSRHGQGLLLCGPSGAGKSTLAYACARAGFTYTSDDASYLLIDSLNQPPSSGCPIHARSLRMSGKAQMPGCPIHARSLRMSGKAQMPAPRVVGHSHKFRLRLHSRELFPELRPREATPRLEGKPSIEVPTSELPGILTAQEVPIHHIILLKRSEEAKQAHLVPIATREALATLQSTLYPVGEVHRRHVAALEGLTNLHAHEFHYWALDDATRALDQLTRKAHA